MYLSTDPNNPHLARPVNMPPTGLSFQNAYAVLPAKRKCSQKMFSFQQLRAGELYCTPLSIMLRNQTNCPQWKLF